MPQYLLNDHWTFNAGYDLRCSSADSALLNVDIENRLRHQGGQFGNEIYRLEGHVGGAIPIWRFQLISNLALIRQ